VWKGAKDQLTRHESPLYGVRVCPNDHGGIYEFLLCLGRRREFFGKLLYDGQFAHLNQLAVAALLCHVYTYTLLQVRSVACGEFRNFRLAALGKHCVNSLGQ
jgi:hypothetical protein